jgi:hypothetical protein
VKIDYPGNLSTFDVLFADRVLFTSEALEALSGLAANAEGGAPGSDQEVAEG